MRFDPCIPHMEAPLLVRAFLFKLGFFCGNAKVVTPANVKVVIVRYHYGD
jgi:hypothetical protein